MNRKIFLVVGAALLAAGVASCYTSSSELSPENEGAPKAPEKRVSLTVNLPPTKAPHSKPRMPDLVVLKLGQCVKTERPCFRIEQREGRRVLVFPAVTTNIGKGPIEVRANRSSASSSDWRPYQIVHYKNGKLQARRMRPGPKFYFAGDGHNHWHMRDFDSYEVYVPGEKLVRGEKHGFCLQDNTIYRGPDRVGPAWSDGPRHPEAPDDPVYLPETSCGEHHQDATSITHGMSPGWGDTYPITLVDQHIDITGLPDGIFTVKVESDWQHLFDESDETNNAAVAKLRIQGNSVELVEDKSGA